MSKTEMLFLKKNCPQCNSPETLIISQNLIKCTQKNCSFKYQFLCPICDHNLTSVQKDNLGSYYQCANCHNKIYLEKIKYLLENSLIINKETRCNLCNNPTIHRKNRENARRCFFFPNCSKQIDLFTETKKEAYVFLDIETTGLEIGKNSIIEIGAIKIDTTGFISNFQTFVKPKEPVNDRITKLTGITNKMLNNAIELKISLQNLADFVGDSIIVAHNAEFDITWLLAGFLHHKINLNCQNILCTLKWAEKIGENNRALETLSKKHNIVHTNAHRAIADAIATKNLFFIFSNTAKQNFELENITNYLPRAQKICEKHQNIFQA